MHIKRFRGADMQEALEKVKKEMGSEAIILSTRHVRGGRGAFGLFGKPMLEVTAAQDNGENSPELEALLASKGRSSPQAEPDPSFGSARSRAETFSILAPLTDEISDLKEMLQNVGTAHLSAFRDSAMLSQLKAEIQDMRQMVHALSSQAQGLRDSDFPENLVVLYQQLTFSGLEEKFARRLLEEALRNIPAGDLDDFNYVKIFLARMMMKIVKVTGELAVEPGRQKVVALVGPTGVGKTTTVAKWASEQSLKHQRRVGLITVDTFRIAAVEQLKVYAKIIGLPITVVSGKTDLQQAIRDFGDKDVVFVDTGGRSQRDDLQMAEIHHLLDGETNMDILLALSATTKDPDLTEITRRFNQLPLKGVVFTKLDESTGFGSIFNHAIRFKLPIAYLTTGQKVPEDMELATRERLVDLLLNISEA
ncbi:MAG: flagellar biosynthesis protein FlhF [Deltaproteobacteria bacterium]|nr:flagellar biosynthesis protein FlhF [Deltaproteobacteria bacterium]